MSLSKLLLKATFVLTLSALLLVSATLWVGAAPATQTADEGAALFKAKGCVGCHTVGKGDLVGPDLKGVTTRRDPAWLKSWLTDPTKMQADPVVVELVAKYKMPMPPTGLKDSEVAAVIAYLESESGGGAPLATPAAAAAPTESPITGNADNGKNLFIGAVRFQNGGPGCIACHTVTGNGALGGGALGPDLTKVFSRFGGQGGLAPVLSSLPFPTMMGIFGNKPLTESEQADLLAYFASADAQGETPSQFTTVFVAGVVIAIILLAVMSTFFSRQQMGIAQRLRKNGKL